jgi:hypothetical protein
MGYRRYGSVGRIACAQCANLLVVTGTRSPDRSDNGVYSCLVGCASLLAGDRVVKIWVAVAIILIGDLFGVRVSETAAAGAPDQTTILHQHPAIFHRRGPRQGGGFRYSAGALSCVLRLLSARRKGVALRYVMG